MRKRIEMSLNEKSINEAIQKINEYATEFDNKCKLFVSKLSNLGLNVVRMTMESIPYEDKGSYYTELFIVSDASIKGAKIQLSGEKVLFVEFGAGVTYSNPQHPKATENGMGVGTYPNQKYAWSMNGWWYTDESGKSEHSYGNPAYMPMYKAYEEMVANIVSIAREVFGNGY